MRKGGFIPTQLLKLGEGCLKESCFFIIGLTIPTNKHGRTDVLWDWATNSLCWSSLQSPSGRGDNRRVFPVKSWELSYSISHWSPSDKVLSWRLQPSGIQARPQPSYHWQQWGLVQRCHWSYLNKKKKKTQMKKKGRQNQTKKNPNLEQVLIGKMRGRK